MSDDGVISLAEAREVRTRRKARASCDHRSVLIDEREMFLECAHCRGSVSPTWWLVRYHTQVSSAIEAGQAEKKRLATEIEELRKERHSLKSQVRRAQSRLEAEP